MKYLYYKEDMDKDNLKSMFDTDLGLCYSKLKDYLFGIPVAVYFHFDYDDHYYNYFLPIYDDVCYNYIKSLFNFINSIDYCYIDSDGFVYYSYRKFLEEEFDYEA